MIPLLLLLHRELGPTPAEEWVPTEIPGLALAYRDDLWYVVHIRSGLAIAEHADRATLATVVPPLVTAFDWTLPAGELLDDPRLRGLRDTMVGLELIVPKPLATGRPGDLDQDPALAPLSGATA